MENNTPTPKPSGETPSEFARRTILERNLSHAEVARLAGLAPAQVGRFVREERDLTTTTFDKLCAGLGLTLVDRKVERDKLAQAMGLVVELTDHEQQEVVKQAMVNLALLLRKL